MTDEKKGAPVKEEKFVYPSGLQEVVWWVKTFAEDDLEKNDPFYTYYFFRPLSDQQIIDLQKPCADFDETGCDAYFIDAQFPETLKERIAQNNDHVKYINAAEFNMDHPAIKPIVFRAANGDLYGLKEETPSYLSRFIKDFVDIPVATIDAAGDITVSTQNSLAAARSFFYGGVDAQTIISFTSLPKKDQFGEGSVPSLRRDISRSLIEVPPKVDLEALARAIAKFPNHRFIVHPDMDGTDAWTVVVKNTLKSLPEPKAEIKDVTPSSASSFTNNFVVAPGESVVVTADVSGNLEVITANSAKVASALFDQGIEKPNGILSFTTLPIHFFARQGDASCIRQDISDELVEIISSEKISETSDEFPVSNFLLNANMSLSHAKACVSMSDKTGFLPLDTNPIYLGKFVTWEDEDYINFAQYLSKVNPVVFLPTMEARAAALLQIHASKKCIFSFHPECSKEMISSVETFRKTLKFRSSILKKNKKLSDAHAAVQLIQLRGPIDASEIQFLQKEHPNAVFSLHPDMGVSLAGMCVTVLKGKKIRIENFSRWSSRDYAIFAEKFFAGSIIILSSTLRPNPARFFVVEVPPNSTLVIGKFASWELYDYMQFAKKLPAHSRIFVLPDLEKELIDRMKLFAKIPGAICACDESFNILKAEQKASAAQEQVVAVGVDLTQISLAPFSLGEADPCAWPKAEIKVKSKGKGSMREDAEANNAQSMSINADASAVPSPMILGYLQFGLRAEQAALKAEAVTKQETIEAPSAFVNPLG